MIKEMDQKYRPEWKWNGRNLENYIAQNPKAKGARTLTEARKLAHGSKVRAGGVCPCAQVKCVRFSGGGKGKDHC